VKPLSRSCQTLRRSSALRCVLGQYQKHRDTSACASACACPAQMACHVCNSHRHHACVYNGMLCSAVEHLIASAYCMSATLLACFAVLYISSRVALVASTYVAVACIGAHGSIISPASLCSITSANTGSHMLLYRDRRPSLGLGFSLNPKMHTGG